MITTCTTSPKSELLSYSRATNVGHPSDGRSDVYLESDFGEIKRL